MDYSKYFQTAFRDNGTNYIKLQDNALKELRDLVFAIHHDSEFDCMPNDWIYEITSEAFEELEDNGNDLDKCFIEADIYTSDLLKWLLNPYACALCNEAVENGLAESNNIEHIIAAGQYLAKIHIYNRVSEFLDNHKHEKEEWPDGD